MVLNTLRPRQDGRLFADDTFKCIFLNENVWIPIKISLKFVPKGPINNIPALVQIMAWRRPGDKPLSEPMLVSLLTYICVTRPQWVKQILRFWYYTFEIKRQCQCCWRVCSNTWVENTFLHLRTTMTRTSFSFFNLEQNILHPNNTCK